MIVYNANEFGLPIDENKEIIPSNKKPRVFDGEKVIEFENEDEWFDWLNTKYSQILLNE